MDFFYGHTSGNSARSAMALYETGADFNARLLDVKAGANKTPEYLAVNPMGKIPGFTDGALHLWESNAINWYLAEKYPQARLLPETPAGRADVHRWIFFQVGHISPAAAPLFRGLHPRVAAYWGFKPDEPAIEQGKKELTRFLPVLEQQLKAREYLAGAFSVADIAYVPHLTLLAEMGYALPPATAAWLAKLQARPSWQKAKQLVTAP